MQVLILNNIPAPYFDPLFEQLGRTPGWSLRVCYSSSWNTNAGWVERPLENSTYRTLILDRMRPTVKHWLGGSLAAGFSLWNELARERPDYIVSYGYTLFPQFVAIVWASLTGTPFALIGDANIHSDLARGVRAVAKRLWLSWVVGRAAAVIAIGTANRRFWEKYGAKKEQLFEARYAVDNEYFAREVESYGKHRAELRESMGLKDKAVFLFVGRLIKRKNVDLIIHAIRDVDNAALLIVGVGEERQALTALAARDDRVVFAGAVPQSDLPKHYAVADVLVLPASDEPWGLVVNEAMASGLAVIAHEHCGAAIDLVASDNGITLSGFTVEEMTVAIRRLTEDVERRRRMQVQSRLKIAPWSVESAARGIVDAVTASAGARIAGQAASAVGEGR